ncbi:hypothetical protein [Pseudomonas chlororaphis]|uniref:hypothetical protein n=1 Tax=Pseudomonas chlororaphis TaxID=587753 RepID=UPI0003D2D073|nr:hypothetical protein [Pseudomonas chlororaphis]AZD26963.1 Tetrapartite efflux system, outer membrane factor lipoprotein FusA-like [Pseudomonas chlororaphis]ETD35610.1 hypothetical protein U724_26500 [Pseudomonas chlororaphis subsp. aurantiaca PB-St2]
MLAGYSQRFLTRNAQPEEVSALRASMVATFNTYTDVRAQLAAADTQVAMSQIDLFLALGGGWESGRTQASSPGKP